ncbi:MAG: HEPN domain-containing protein [Pseudomonadota bacterium]
MPKNRQIQAQLHQKIIHNIVEIIKEIGKDKIAFVILFGSFAKDSWVYDLYQEDGVFYEYASDYDFLVITKSQNLNFNSKLEDKIKAQISRKHLDRVHPTTIIIEPLNYVNSQIEKSQYFFLDIKKEGKILFVNNDLELAHPKQLDAQEKMKTAQEDYIQWIKNGESFLRDSKNALDLKDYKISAFYLHQATESLYSCALLVLIGYKPKSHNLEVLSKLCSSQNNQFLTIFPNQTLDQTTSFKLLNTAYIEARYSKKYQISKEQLEYLVAKVEKLREVVKAVCGAVLLTV